jgi:hypothetical protein
LNITRSYASSGNALNARKIMEDLIVSELEKIIHSSTKKESHAPINNEIGSECC